jgi:predicted small integral membrane protein
MRLLKIFLALCVALWGLIGFVSNIADLGGVASYVRSVTALEWAENPAIVPWATQNSVLVWLGVVLIVLGKFAPMVGGGAGALIMTSRLGASPEAFAGAKRWAVMGAGYGFGLLFLGFIVVGEMAFAMFFDPALEGASQGAWRYGGSMGLIAIFLAQPE